MTPFTKYNDLTDYKDKTSHLPYTEGRSNQDVPPSLSC